MDQRRIGRFRIVGEHGQGTMGLILRGQDDALGRTAAIKLLTPQRLSDPEALARFRREAQAVALLKHDHIAALYEFSEDATEPFLAMEWVDGVTLQSRLAQGRLELELSVQLLGQMLSALDYAHARGVVHRDIKPSNLILAHGDRLTVVDFGLACVLAEPSLTATGPLFGTPLYMAPEIASGGAVDGRADLYSAALVFFELLTGKPAFGPGTVVQIISQQMNAPRPVLSEHVAGLPVALDEVLLKALDRQPERRYANGQSFLEAVRGACVQNLVPKRGIPLKWVGVALVALATGAYLSLPTPAPSPEATKTPSLAAQKQTPTPDSRLQWLVATTGVKSLALNRAGLVACTESQLEVVETSSGKVRWSSPQTGTPWLLYDGDASLLLVGPDGLDCLRMSDGQKAWHEKLGPVLASVLSDDEELFVLSGNRLLALDPATRSEDWHVPFAAPNLLVNPVANKAAVFVVTQGPRIRAFEADSGRQVWQCKPPGAPSCLALTSHGLVVGCQDGQVACYSLIDGRDRWDGSYTHSGPVQALHAGEDQVVITCSNGELAAYDSEGSPLWLVQLGESPYGAAVTDEERVLVATKTGKLLCLDALRGRERWAASLGQPCRAQPLLAEGQVFVPLQSGLAAYKVAP